MMVSEFSLKAYKQQFLQMHNENVTRDYRYHKCCMLAIIAVILMPLKTMVVSYFRPEVDGPFDHIHQLVPACHPRTGDVRLGRVPHL